MKKNLFALFVLVLAVLVGLPAMVEAQSRRYYEVRDAIYGRGYGRGYPVRQDRYGYDRYYDPAYLEQMFKLPESLVACQLNFDTGRYEGCHTLLKTIDYMEGHALRHEERNEFLGTYHPHEIKRDGKKIKVRHFRAFDDTNRRIGSVEAGAITATAAAVATHVATRRMQNRAAANITTVGVATAAGLAVWWNQNRNKHDNCEEIGQPQAAEFEQEVSPVSYVEQGTQPNTLEVESRDESHGPAYHSGPHPLTNASRVYVDIYDGDRESENFVGTMESGDSWDLARPRDRYRGWAQVPNERGSFDAEELSREVNPTGWTFVEPAVARGR